MFSAGMDGAFSFRMRAFVLAGLATTRTCFQAKQFLQILCVRKFGEELENFSSWRSYTGEVYTGLPSTTSAGQAASAFCIWFDNIHKMFRVN